MVKCCGEVVENQVGHIKFYFCRGCRKEPSHFHAEAVITRTQLISARDSLSHQAHNPVVFHPSGSVGYAGPVALNPAPVTLDYGNLSAQLFQNAIDQFFVSRLAPPKELLVSKDWTGNLTSYQGIPIKKSAWICPGIVSTI
mgnify:CR=1 FL=1